jgi:hypothetical protein
LHHLGSMAAHHAPAGHGGCSITEVAASSGMLDDVMLVSGGLRAGSNKGEQLKGGGGVRSY